MKFFEPTYGISWFIIIQNNEDTIHIECCLCSFSLPNVQCFHLVLTLLLHFWIHIDNTRHRKGTIVSLCPFLLFNTILTSIQHYSHKYLESREEKPRWLEMFLRKKVSTLAAPPSASSSALSLTSISQCHKQTKSLHFARAGLQFSRSAPALCGLF